MMTLVSREEVKPVAADRKELFEALYAEHEDSLRRIAHQLTKNEADADDLFQESMFRAYRSFDLFEEGTNFGAWVNMIMRNAFFTDRRKSKIRPTLVDASAMEVAQGAVEASTERMASQVCDLCPENQIGEEFRSAIGELPDRYRQVVELSDVCGLKYREVAQHAGIPVGTVMSRLSRGRRMLRFRLRNLVA